MHEISRKLNEIYRPFRWALAVMLGFSILGQVFNLVPAFVIGKLMELLIANAKEPQFQVGHKVSLLLAGLLASQLFSNVILRYLRERFEIRYVDKSITFHVSAMTLKWMFGLSPGQHQRLHSSTKRSVVDKGQRSLADVGRILVYDLIPTSCEVVIVTIALFCMDTSLGLIILSGIVTFIACAAYINYVTWAERLRIEEIEEDYDRQYGEVVSNLELVIASAQEERTSRKCLSNLTAVNEQWRRLHYWACRLSVYRDTIVDATKVAVLAFGTYLVLTDVFTPSYIVVFSGWSLNALTRMGRIGGMQRDLMQHTDQLRRFFKLMELETDVPVAKNPIKVENFAGQIEFRRVAMSYPHATQRSLTDVSFLIRPGECVALVGESGAGKTTITRLLLRYQDPNAGQILVDGHDLRLLDLGRFRTAIGRVEQEVALFDATLRYNLTFGLGDRTVSDEEIMLVCKQACLDKVLARMSKGLDTIVGERGVKLSGGEKQRVGIARALLKNPAILVFDEATSNLDAENEHLIQEAIGKAAEGRTTIIIAHRFSTIKRVDRAVVFEQGRVVGVGTHDELRKRCRQYEKLLKRQLV
jgi:ATP-binding cassette subfamily B protein